VSAPVAIVTKGTGEYWWVALGEITRHPSLATHRTTTHTERRFSSRTEAMAWAEAQVDDSFGSCSLIISRRPAVRTGLIYQVDCARCGEVGSGQTDLPMAEQRAVVHHEQTVGRML